MSEPTPPDQPPRVADEAPLVTCPHCGSAVPAGEYCGHCGANLRTADTARRHAFAAVPAESVLSINVITTLFPHLPHRRGGSFSWALLAGVAFVVLLAALHFFAPATAAAAVLLPALYLLYLYEVEIYAREPWLLIGATMVAGAILGLAFTQVAGDEASGLSITGDRSSAFVLQALAIPIVAQVLMLVGPLALFGLRGRYREPLDGLTFGAASALGFSLSSELSQLWPVISGPLVASGSSLEWALHLLRIGVLVSLVNASTTGLITASLWLQRYDPRRSRHAREVSLPIVLVIAVGAQLALGIITFFLTDLVGQLLVWLAAAIMLTLYVRQVIHQALLAEGAGHEIGPPSQCPECHRIVPAMLFCPHCGAARAAAPRSASGRPG